MITKGTIAQIRIVQHLTGQRTIAKRTIVQHMIGQRMIVQCTILQSTMVQLVQSSSNNSTKSQ